MHRRLCYWILAGLAVASIAGVTVWRHREPRYQGVPLGRWLQRAERGDYPEEPPAEVLEAEEAVRQIGAQAVPLLLRWLSAEDPAWKRAAAARLAHQRMFRLEFHWAERDHEAALNGFGLLRWRATNAIPALGELLAKPNSAVRAANALAAIGTNGAPLLGQALRSGDVDLKLTVLRATGGWQGNAKFLLPELRTLIHDSNARVRMTALFHLCHALPAKEILPLLEQEAQAAPENASAMEGFRKMVLSGAEYPDFRK